MKKIAAFIFLTICLLPGLYAQKTRLGQEPPKAKQGVDYPIQLHVTGVRIRSECGESLGNVWCSDILYVDAVLAAMKIELAGNVRSGSAYVDLHPGDYRARLKSKNAGAVPAALGLGYELLLPDNFVWSGSISGFAE